MTIKKIFQNKKILIISALAVLVLCAGGGAFYYFQQREEPELEYNPGLSRELSEQAEAFINQAEYEQSEKLAQQAVDLDPNNISAYILLARSKYVLGKTEQARDVYKNGLERNPNSFEMNFYIANVYRDLAEYESSARHYEKAIEINPDDVLVWSNYAFLYGFVQEKWDKAIEIYGNALKRFPDNQSLQSMYEMAKERAQESGE